MTIHRNFLAALCAVVLTVCAWGVLPTTTVTYNVALPGGTAPATLTATATVTYVASADPAVLNRPITGTYSASDMTVTWTLPQNSQVRFTCPQTGLNDVVALGSAASYTLNSLVPVSTPATAPAYMGNYLLRDGTNDMSAALPLKDYATGSLPATADEGALAYDTTLNTLAWWTGAAWSTPVVTESDPLSMHTAGGMMTGTLEFNDGIGLRYNTNPPLPSAPSYFQVLAAPSASWAWTYPDAAPAGTSLLNITSGGQVGYDSSTYLTAESDPLSLHTSGGVLGAGATITVSDLPAPSTKFTSEFSSTGVAVTTISGRTPIERRLINDLGLGFHDIATDTYLTIEGPATHTGTYVLRPPDCAGTLWADCNDGASSGLDADTLDGSHASAFLTAEADTLATVTGRGATSAQSLTLTGASPLALGADVAGGSPNVPGWLKMFSAGDNAYYTTATAGTQTQNIAYTLPVDDGDASEFLQTNGSGVLSWETVPADGDSVTGNEITNVSGTTLTRSGAGTSGDPYLVALNTGNANTWTAAQTVDTGGNLSAIVTGLSLTNDTQSTVSDKIQESPALRFEGHAWDNAGNDDLHSWRVYAKGAVGSPSSSTMTYLLAKDGGAETTIAQLSSGGEWYAATRMRTPYYLAGTSIGAAGSYYLGYDPGSGGYPLLSAEGSTADGNETVISVTDPTADRTVTVPDESGLVQLNGTGTIADGDATPSVAGARIWTTSGNTAPTEITDLDNPTVGQIYIVICGNTTNASTITDGGNFALSANWTPDSVGDNITLYVQADNTYYELGRSNN